jgi:hypothetical protein
MDVIHRSIIYINHLGMLYRVFSRKSILSPLLLPTRSFNTTSRLVRWAMRTQHGTSQQITCLTLAILLFSIKLMIPT